MCVCMCVRCLSFYLSIHLSVLCLCVPVSEYCATYISFSNELRSIWQ